MQNLCYILAFLLLTQERPYQGNVPRETGRICAPIAGERDRYEQRAREAETSLAYAQGRIAGLELQLQEIPAAQGELWRVVDELRLVKAERDDLKRVAQHYAGLLQEYNADFESLEDKLKRTQADAAYWQREAGNAELRNILQKRKPKK